MNVYDFDRTLFPGDSSMHFWAYCKNKYPLIWLHFPAGITKMALYKLKLFYWGDVMEKFFSFMKYIPSSERERIIEERLKKKALVKKISLEEFLLSIGSSYEALMKMGEEFRASHIGKILE
jgi:hypothetical protein